MNIVKSTERLLEAVKKYQASNQLSDRQMAEKLGCSRVLYQQTRTGKTKIGDAFIRGATKLFSGQPFDNRKSVINRKTNETEINLELAIDGQGSYQINTGIKMCDHLLAQLARHGMFDIKIEATGDDPHHLVEDVAICLGKAFGEALGEKRGIVRMADALVPMDETLVSVAVDIGGRGYAVLDLPFAGNDMTGFSAELVRHFLESFAIEARMNLHARILYGTNDHHKAEALFKALGRALDAATRIDPRIGGLAPSTKGVLER